MKIYKNLKNLLKFVHGSYFLGQTRVYFAWIVKYIFKFCSDLCTNK